MALVLIITPDRECHEPAANALICDVRAKEALRTAGEVLADVERLTRQLDAALPG